MWTVGELDWQDGTQACHNPGVDPEWFFSEDLKTQLYVIRICNDCPLIADCREYALNNNVVGVWGGLTEAALSAQRKKLGIIPKSITGNLLYESLGVLKPNERKK